MVVRVLLAEDNVLLREGLTKVIDGQDDLEVVGACGDLPTLLEHVDKPTLPTSSSPTSACPRPGPTRAFSAANQLRDDQPSVGVVVLSQYANPSLRAGPSG